MNKTKSQLQMADEGFRVSNHRFMNMIASGISALIAETVPGLKLQYTGKSIRGDSISAVLIGKIQLADKEELDSTSDKVRITMQGLKNPSNLLATMRE